MQNVRLEDIAKKMGISVVTVSNALAGRKGVSDKLRAEIKATAKSMGYLKRSRQDKKTAPKNGKAWGRRVVVVTNETYIEKYTSFYWELYQKTVFYASKLGCVAMLEIFSKDMEKNKVVPQLIEEESVDGVIILGKAEREYLLSITERSRVPVVLLDFNDDSVECDSVISNGFYGMYTMTNYLFNAGHKDIAFVGSIMANDSIMDRYQGYTKSLMEHGVEQREDWILPDRDLVTGKNTVIDLPEQMPTAFVCNCDYTAAILISELKLEGYKVPEDISVVGYDDYLVESKWVDFITTYAVDMDSMAKTALKLLMKKIDGTGNRRMLSVVDGHPVIRNSVKKI